MLIRYVVLNDQLLSAAAIVMPRPGRYEKGRHLGRSRRRFLLHLQLLISQPLDLILQRLDFLNLRLQRFDLLLDVALCLYRPDRSKASDQSETHRCKKPCPVLPYTPP